MFLFVPISNVQSTFTKNLLLVSVILNVHGSICYAARAADTKNHWISYRQTAGSGTQPEPSEIRSDTT